MMPAEYRLGNYTPKGWIFKKALTAFGGYSNLGVIDGATRSLFDDNLGRAIEGAIDAYEQLKQEKIL